MPDLPLSAWAQLFLGAHWVFLPQGVRSPYASSRMVEIGPKHQPDIREDRRSEEYGGGEYRRRTSVRPGTLSSPQLSVSSPTRAFALAATARNAASLSLAADGLWGEEESALPRRRGGRVRPPQRLRPHCTHVLSRVDVLRDPGFVGDARGKRRFCAIVAGADPGPDEGS